MSLKVGVIGVGMIGQDDVRRLTNGVAGAAVVTSWGNRRTQPMCRDLPTPARLFPPPPQQRVRNGAHAA